MGDVRYAKSGDLSIAYRQLSESGPDLLMVPGFVAHVMANDEAPPVAHFVDPFARVAKVVVFDKRGTGMSDRAGLHTGEVEVVGEDVAGIAVHLGARVSSLAGPGEVLVSRTVADLVAGSGIGFADRGEHELKGLPGTWRLLAAQV